jgi:hypothetical protein
LLRGIVRALIVFKRRRRNPDTPRVPVGFANQGKKPEFKTVVKEVWFTGSHSGNRRAFMLLSQLSIRQRLMRIVLNIGGGLARDTEEYALSNILLRWMMRKIVEARCHIHFDKTVLKLWNIPCATIMQVPMTCEPSDSTLCGDETDFVLWKEIQDKDIALTGEEANPSISIAQHTSALLPTAQVHICNNLDMVDAVQEMSNAFKKNPFWWILEVLPTYHEWQNEEDKWVGKWGRGERKKRKTSHVTVT